MRGRERFPHRASGERIRGRPQRPRPVQGLGTGRLAARHRRSRERHEEEHSDRDRSAARTRHICAQHLQHLLQFPRQLGRIPHAARSIPGRPESLAQPYHVIGHRAIEPRSPQRARQGIAIAQVRVGQVTRENRMELALQPAESSRCRRCR